MREIKFRAWDKENKEWIINFQVSHDGLIRWLKPDPKNLDKLEWQSIIGHDVELVQFTGLYDKNGKEIYEGDIIEYDSQEEDHRMIQEKVNFRGGAFYPVCEFPEEEFEIIGNIYENKVLIK